MQTCYTAFNGRRARSEFLFDQYREAFNESVLDVGCFEAPIREMVNDAARYTGVDFVGNPDIELNLEKCDSLPFADASYHTVICIEVLEHLENLHQIIDELFRVAKKEAIISLPNCWCSARTPIAKGRGTIAHYGLPLERPIDRHKWFLSVSDVKNFFEDYAEKHPKIESVEITLVEKPRPYPVVLFRRLTNRGSRYNNKYVHTVFGHFKLK